MTPLPPFVCEVVQVHDGDGPLWCRSGEKVRVAGIQVFDFERVPNLTVVVPLAGQRTPATMQRLSAASRVSHLTLNQRLCSVLPSKADLRRPDTRPV